jgi:hypothetical protein
MKLKIRKLVSSSSVAYVSDCLRQVNIHKVRITEDGIVFQKQPSDLQVRHLRRELGNVGFEKAVWDGPLVA